MIEHFKSVFAYSDWAYRHVADAVTGLSVVPEALLDLFGHSVVAEKVWYLRVTGSDETPPPIWPKMNLDQIRAQMDENKAAFEALFAEIGSEGLSRSFEYKTSKGVPFTNTIEDILNQLTIHASYHRGQMNKMIREFGGKPARIDYIIYKREGAQ